jgi:hypothetical protein
VAAIGGGVGLTATASALWIHANDQKTLLSLLVLIGIVLGVMGIVLTVVD